jgi:hypothetical protein
LPFKLNQDRRHHIPKQKHKVTNWREYDAGLRQRGSLTVWFTDEAVQAWRAEPRTTRGGQPWYSPLAILTALTLRAVFRLPFRQTEGLIGSVIGLLGLDLAVPDHTTLCRRAETLEVPRPRRRGDGEPVHLLVDSTGLKLCGAGEWLVEKHGTRTRRSWRKMHFGVDADTGRIVAATLTDRDVDDASQVGPLLDQVMGSVASFTGDGAYDQEGVYAGVGERHPDAAVVVPPRSTAVPSDTAETAPTQRDRHIQLIAETGRMGWQTAAGYNIRARIEATMGRFKQVIGDGLRSRTDQRRATEVNVAVPCAQPHAGVGTPGVRPHRLTPERGRAYCACPIDPCNTAMRVETMPPPTGAEAIVATLDSTFIRSCEAGGRHLEVRIGNVETTTGRRQVFGAVARTETDLGALIRRGLDAVGRTEGTTLTAFTDGCPGLRRSSRRRRRWAADPGLVPRGHAAAAPDANR